jgi:hypothetical protein
MTDKMFENIPGKSNPNASGTIRSTATKLPAKSPSSDDSKPLLDSKEMKKLNVGGSVGSASKRADGIAQRGKTRGKMC